MYFPPEPGGGANTAWNRATIFHKLGHTVFILCGFPSYPNGKVIEPIYKGKFFYVEKMEKFTLIRLRLLPLESKGCLRQFILYINFKFLTLFWMPRILNICVGTFIYSPNYLEALQGEQSTTQKILAMTTLLKEKKSFLEVIYYADKSNFNDYLPAVEHMIKSFQFQSTKLPIQED